MRHYLPANLTNDEWRKKFRIIREEFISQFDSYISDKNIIAIKACSDDGEPWGWCFEMTSSEIIYHDTGTSEDARDYLRSTIDQGLRVAFCAEQSDAGTAIWLTNWEGRASPVWPSAIDIDFQLVHLGVTKSEDVSDGGMGAKTARDSIGSGQ